MKIHIKKKQQRHLLKNGTTGRGKLFPERNVKAASRRKFPGITETEGCGTAAIRRKIQTVRNTPASCAKEFFDIAFQYEFIKYSALVTQRILFYPAGEKPPGTVTRAIHHPRQAIFIIFPAIFHHETNDTYADSHAPIADHVYSVSEPA
ncbi:MULTISPECIES: hypothetical protein [Akkermansia]|uniref:hypothetical protein n=1 Tax=Akkermansia TaxID=239934 RepID=UPI000FE40912|nr:MULTISPECIES: hypothetical protein [Akkermansia]MBS6357164.1 hypothetical protein [Akkermansia muciniphila]MBT8789012.1 hypothetical protein [Akkermansia muciniphila]MCD8320828.1 hypothetical protein [Akkermansia sp.]MCG4598474.1 hypothetical protein [Akkermansia muciniphila]MCI5894903.1 hypothetical protein [Akkermansia muciniphila]